MAFAMTFCPGIAWIIAQLPSKSIVIEYLNFEYSIWRIFLFFCALMSGFTSLGLSFLPESPKFYLAHNQHEKAMKVMRMIFSWNTKQPISDYPVEEIRLDENYVARTRERSFFKLMWNQTIPLFQSPFLLNTLRTSFLMFLLFAGSSGFYMWTPDILNILMRNNDTDSTVCHVVLDVVEHRSLWVFFKVFILNSFKYWEFSIFFQKSNIHRHKLWICRRCESLRNNFWDGSCVFNYLLHQRTRNQQYWKKESSEFLVFCLWSLLYIFGMGRRFLSDFVSHGDIFDFGSLWQYFKRYSGGHVSN